MKKLALTFLTALAFISPSFADDVVVIVHASNTDKVATEAFQNIYLNKTKAFPGGAKAVPLMMEAGPPELEVFLTDVLGKNTSQYRAFWARLLFSGQGTPPQTMKTSKDVVTAVERNPDAIGVVFLADTRQAKVRVLPIPFTK